MATRRERVGTGGRKVCLVREVRAEVVVGGVKVRVVRLVDEHEHGLKNSLLFNFYLWSKRLGHLRWKNRRAQKRMEKDITYDTQDLDNYFHFIAVLAVTHKI